MPNQERYAALEKQPLVTVGGVSASRSGASLIASLRDIFAHRDLLDRLIKRDLKARYKDSALGFIWTLIKPLTQLVIYYYVLGTFLGAARNIPEFAIFIFAGLTIYGLFSEIVSGGTSSIVENTGLIKKIYLPREIFPLASLGSALFNSAIQFGILILATIILGSFPWSANLIYLVPSVLLIVVFALALSLLLSAVNVYLRDVQYLVEVAMMVLMWASPIVYSWELVHQQLGNGILMSIYTNNPITLAVLGFQKAMWTAGADQPGPDNLFLSLWVALGLSLIALFGTHAVFRRLQGNFAQLL
ncbi:ABC transporter permease [Lysinibacter sp. HNR]|uniref:ABC transporter permease n=1 Tax=Lysinibacter sp. HNR TaxID=3031408 RepID=UPI002434E65B|nr:ABC transporter permease [Lysinibacter sp. HNR]WGD38076.1 ABC transporter permease [Lysinibacter sp. HNR]